MRFCSCVSRAIDLARAALADQGDDFIGAEAGTGLQSHVDVSGLYARERRSHAVFEAERQNHLASNRPHRGGIERTDVLDEAGLGDRLNVVDLHVDVQAVGAELLTVSPRQRCETFWERVVMPQIWLLLGIRYHPRRVNRATRERDVIANGQFILVRRESYEAVGTHEAVRAEVAEDLALAQAFHRAGRKLYFAFAESLTPEERRAFTHWRDKRRTPVRNYLDEADHQAGDAAPPK